MLSIIILYTKSRKKIKTQQLSINLTRLPAKGITFQETENTPLLRPFDILGGWIWSISLYTSGLILISSHEATIALPSVSKKLQFWKIFQIKKWKFFGTFSYVWMAECLFYYMTDQQILKYLMLGCALATFVKSMKLRLRRKWLSILAAEVTQVRSPPA